MRTINLKRKIVFALRCMTAACVARDFQVIESPCIRVQVQGEAAIAGFEFACAAALWRLRHNAIPDT